MEIIQVLIIIFALFAMSRAILRFRDGKLTKSEFLFWLAVWLAIIVFAFTPNLTTQISILIGIGRGMDLLMYVSVIVLFYLMFRLYVKAESLEKDITFLVRKFAIENDKKEKKK